ITREDVLRAAQPAPAAPARPAAPPPAPARATSAGATSPGVLAAPMGTAPAGLSEALRVPGGQSAFKVPPYSPQPGDKVVPFSRRRRIIADHMVYSKLSS